MAVIHKNTIPLLALLFVLLVAASTIDGRQIKSRESNRTLASTDTTLNPAKLEESKMNEDDFRPTTPGNSPGVGHSFQGLNKTPQHNTNSEYVQYTTGSVSDFKPTGSSQSPGVGHTVEDDSVKTKV